VLGVEPLAAESFSVDFADGIWCMLSVLNPSMEEAKAASQACLLERLVAHVVQLIPQSCGDELACDGCGALHFSRSR
jgi:ABC-type thiamin/hydroxymethylpyrimidine transport system permease subunit